MVKNKDRFRALPIKERAALINKYVSGGVMDLGEIRKHYNSFEPGCSIKTDEYGYPADITPAIVTQDSEFNKFLMTLPDNQRLTPEEDYHTYLSWKLNGKPKTFQDAVDNDLMYSWDDSDNSYHGHSVAYDESTDTYHGLKPLFHPTASMDYVDWYQKGLHTLPGGKQVPLEGKGKKEWEDFRNSYDLVFEGNDFKYVPKNSYSQSGDFKNGGKINKFGPGGDLDEEPIYMGELEPAVVKPEPLDGYLNTYYPLVSSFPFTGHSELQLVDFGFKEPITITKYGTDYDYNLVTNNCSDATRCAVEKIFGEKINPVLFTTPGDVQDFVVKKIGEKPFKTAKGVATLGFEVPFATAMDLKNQNIDFYIQDYLHKSKEFKKKQQKENPKWDSSGFDENVKKVIEGYENLKYKFQPFVGGYEIDESGNYRKANGGKLNIFDIGGDKDTWYKRLYSWIFNDDNAEETSPQENKYLTNDNYLDEVSKFISTFEEFYPNAYEDTHNGKNIWTVGSGLTYLLDDEGNEIKVKKGDTITKEENINQLNKRLQKNIDYVKSKTQYWDNYPAELKFQLLDAMYNIGAPKVWNPETNYIKAIMQYENEKGWENPEYDLKNIFQHADWNLNNKGWLGIRSRMRRNPQSINVEDFSKIYKNDYRDSLRTVYDLKFQNN